MVFKSIKRFWRRLCYFINAKKIWSRPRQSDVLIYDATSQEILLEYLNPWHPEVLHLRGEQINMQVLFFRLFRSWTMPDAYADCFIEKVRPRLVVTAIDNNPSFYTISQRHPEVKTLFVQNGWRGNNLDVFDKLEEVGFDVSRNYFVDYMLVFGSVIGEKYAQYIKGNTVIVGSIANNFMRKEKLPERGVIAFLSTTPPWEMLTPFSSREGNSVWAEDLIRPADRPVIQCLMRYAKEKNKRLIIIPRCPISSELFVLEEAYFKSLMGCETAFFRPDGACPGLQAVDSAEIVVTIDSTLGYESIARGNKTAFFSFRSKLCKVWPTTFGWPRDFQDEGSFWTKNPDPDSFVRILDYLFEVDDVQWRKDIESINFSSLMVYDPGNTVLKSTLEKVLGAPPVFKD